MACCPALYDTHRMALAVHSYYVAPSDVTLRELNEARAADRRDILIFEMLAGVILALCLVAFVRIGTRSVARR
jgi:hypothetical protein